MFYSNIECTWLTPTKEDNVMKCNDGSYCNGLKEGWSCCNDKGGRAKCHKNEPIMCLEKECGDNRAHCCASTQEFCEIHHGGIRPCNGK